MDLLSLTLTVVSIVKDLVDLGQKIHELSAKISTNNLRNAQHVAWDIKEMMTEIKVFCEDHVDALDDIKDFCAALQGLLDKFRSFETSILPLLPQTGGGKCILIRGWRNNNKIESRILDLQSDIVKVMWRYMLRSTIRTKAKQKAIHREDFGVPGDSTANFSPGPSGTTGEHGLVKTDHDVKYQVRSMLWSLDMLKLPTSAPDNVPKFQWLPMLEVLSMSVGDLRHHTMQQITLIRKLLGPSRVAPTSVIYNSTRALMDLAIGLQQLDMGHESILVGNLAIMFARTLVEAFNGGDPDRWADLAACLHSQSARYYLSGDKIHSLQTINEAYTIARNLRDQYTIKYPFQILYSLVLTQYAEVLDNERSTEMTTEAIHVLEDILGFQAFTLRPESREKFIIESVIQPSLSSLDHLVRSSTALSIPNYALALQNLGVYLFRDVHAECALDLQLLAVAVRREIVSIHGHEYRVHLARSLSSLVQGETACRIPTEKLVGMADECIEIYRELAVKNPRMYSRELVDVLRVKACALGNLERDTEAITTWEEFFSLTGQIPQDFKLCSMALDNLKVLLRHCKIYDGLLRTNALGMELTYREQPGAHGLAEASPPPQWKESADTDNVLNIPNIDAYTSSPSRTSPKSVITDFYSAYDYSARGTYTNSTQSISSTSASALWSTAEGNHNVVAEKLAQLSITSLTTSDSTATTDYGSFFLSRDI